MSVTPSSRLLELFTQHMTLLATDVEGWSSLMDQKQLTWDMPYAPTFGAPNHLPSFDACKGVAVWFGSIVEDFKFTIDSFSTFEGSNGTRGVAEVSVTCKIKPSGKPYAQTYVFFIHSSGTDADAKITYLKEYFDPVRISKSMDKPLVL